jgi:hypothetical protein
MLVMQLCNLDNKEANSLEYRRYLEHSRETSTHFGLEGYSLCGRFLCIWEIIGEGIRAKSLTGVAEEIHGSFS